MAWFEEKVNQQLVIDGKALGLNPSFYPIRDEFLTACRKQGEDSLTFKRAINLQHEVQISSRYGMFAKMGADPEYAKTVKAGAKLCSEVDTDIAMAELVPSIVKSAMATHSKHF